MTAQAERRRRGRAIRKQHRAARAALANAWKVGDLVDAVRPGLQRLAEACAATLRGWFEAWRLSARAIWQALTTPVNGESSRGRDRARGPSTDRRGGEGDEGADLRLVRASHQPHDRGVCL